MSALDLTQLVTDPLVLTAVGVSAAVLSAGSCFCAVQRLPPRASLPRGLIACRLSAPLPRVCAAYYKLQGSPKAPKPANAKVAEKAKAAAAAAKPAPKKAADKPVAQQPAPVAAPKPAEKPANPPQPAAVRSFSH